MKRIAIIQLSVCPYAHWATPSDAYRWWQSRNCLKILRRVVYRMKVMYVGRMFTRPTLLHNIQIIFRASWRAKCVATAMETASSSPHLYEYLSPSLPLSLTAFFSVLCCFRFVEAIDCTEHARKGVICFGTDSIVSWYFAILLISLALISVYFYCKCCNRDNWNLFLYIMKYVMKYAWKKRKKRKLN